MHASTFWIIKIAFGIIAASFTLLATFLTFLDASQNDQTDATRHWFSEKWKVLNRDRWAYLPEHVARWLLRVWVDPGKIRDSFLGRGDNLVILLASVHILLLIGLWIQWRGWGVLIFLAFGLLVIVSLVLDQSIFFAGPFVSPRITVKVIGLGGLLSAYLWLKIVLSVDLYTATILMMILIPFYWTMLLLALRLLDALVTLVVEKIPELDLFVLGVAGGLATTFLGLAIGHLSSPTAYVPKTFQMLLSNVIFDGMTMVVTFTLLSRAIAKSGIIWIPFAVFLDLIFSAVFASCSLYFGLVHSQNALTLKELLHVLAGRSFDNSHFEFPPIFWAMHTTFLPTLAYLSFLMLCWCGKVLLIPTRWFFGRGQEHKNPLKLTATLCAMFAASFTILYFVTNEAYLKAKDAESNPGTTVSGNARKTSDVLSSLNHPLDPATIVPSLARALTSNNVVSVLRESNATPNNRKSAEG